MDQPKRPSHLRVHNVSLHRRGRAEYGTLSVEKHHLKFSYIPSSAANQDSKSKSNQSAAAVPSLTTEGSAASRLTVTSSDTVRTQDSHLSVNPASSDKPRADPKTVWIAYPMINHCILRPSHAQSNTNRFPAQDAGFTSNDDDEDLFPPTYGTSSFERPSTDSARLGPYSSPARPASPAGSANNILSTESGRPPAIRIRCRDFQMMAFHFHTSSTDRTPDETARSVFFELRNRCCVRSVRDILAFHFVPPQQEVDALAPIYDARKEYARMGIGGKAAEGPGSAWRISDINHDYSYSATYPSVLCVPRTVSDNLLKYGGAFRSRARIPCLSYLHFNGGSITRSSQPLVGVQGKRSPQDERLVSAIFTSHTPPLGSPADSPPQLPSLDSASSTVVGTDGAEPDTLQEPSDAQDDISTNEESVPTKRPKIYGSTRRNYIVDARPRVNMMVNKASGGGVEDVANYNGNGDVPIEKEFLDIANIHVMRSSLQKVIETMANSDYVSIPPNQDALRKSGWLAHMAALVEGSELVARVVGLGGSHALIHCSDGWDRTAQVSGLAQVMLDPHARTFTGFITVIQKDFLSFGHKFRDRHGLQGCEKWFEIENERIAPSKPSRDDSNAESNGINNFGAKALSGAKNWFEKNRNNLFRQQNSSSDSLADRGSAPTPPPNPLLHAPPTNSPKEDKEHKTKPDEIAPIFHQFLEGVYQLLRQRPNAFEFNEKLLLRLLYQSYSGQYREFLFNNEKERQQQLKENVPSVWSHFAARKEQFLNPDYDPKAEDSLLLPKRTGPDQTVEIRWWHKLFGRDDAEMNVPRALQQQPSDPPTIPSLDLRSTHSSLDLAGARADAHNNVDVNDAIMNSTPSKSVPSALNRTRDSIASSFSTLSMSMGSAPNKMSAASTSSSSTTPASSSEPASTAPSSTAEISLAPVLDEDDLATPIATQPASRDTSWSTLLVEGEDGDAGDPLGVGSSSAQVAEVKKGAGGEKKGASGSASGAAGLDFRAFAAQNAFSER